MSRCTKLRSSFFSMDLYSGKTMLKPNTAFHAVLQLYNRYYKRYAARARAGSITANSFKKWKYEAVVKRDQCTEGSLSLEEFDRWMNGYFPKKKVKRKK